MFYILKRYVSFVWSIERKSIQRGEQQHRKDDGPCHKMTELRRRGRPWLPIPHTSTADAGLGDNAFQN